MTERSDLYIMHFVYKHVINGISALARTMENDYTKKEEVSRVLRSHRNLVQPKINTTFARSVFLYKSTVLWNSLPLNIQESLSFMSFDSNLRTHILNLRKD